ncbi:MAG: SelL-related redox protein [Bacteroidota bacterium]
MQFASVYHIVWGLFLIVRPTLLLEWASLPLPQYPILIQGVGGVVLVFGVAYAIAAKDVMRHWLMVFMAFLLKSGAFVGTTVYFAIGVLGTEFMWFSLVNDLLWLPLLGSILQQVFMQYETHQYIMDRRKMRISGDLLDHYEDQYGTKLSNLTEYRPVLLVFMRHFGCTFCREAMEDLGKQRQEIEAEGTRICIVHMSPPERANEFFAKYGLEDVSRISDPEKRMYHSFGLPRGNFQQMFGWKSWLRGFFAGVLKGHWVGRQEGDGWQMPGAFLIYKDEIVQSFRHQTASDRPDYLSLAQCEVCV